MRPRLRITSKRNLLMVKCLYRLTKFSILTPNEAFLGKLLGYSFEFHLQIEVDFWFTFGRSDDTRKSAIIFFSFVRFPNVALNNLLEPTKVYCGEVSDDIFFFARQTFTQMKNTMRKY